MKFSIIIPNYNNSKYIDDCLKSIMKQKYNNYEVIFIDDGSTDDSVKKVQQFCKENNFKVNIINQFNQNASVARNRGIENATGDYVIFLDSDDMLCEDYLENVSAIIKKNNKCDLILGNYYIINETNDLVSEYLNKDYLCSTDDDVYKYCLVSPVPSNKVYSMDIIKRNNIYFGNVKIGQDLNFYLKYLLFCKKIILTEDYFYLYRIQNNGITRSKNLNFLDIINSFNDIKKFYLLNSRESLYYKYISLCEVIHYDYQITRIKQFNDLKTKVFIKKYFNYFISNINKKNIVDKKLYCKVRNKIFLRNILFPVYIFKKW